MLKDNPLNIKRGTTPTITMNIPEDIDLTKVTNMWFSISQSGNTSEPLIKRNMDSCNVDSENHKVWVLLTQEETLRLMPTAREGIGYSNNLQALVELSIIYDNGVRSTSKKQTATVLDSVREGVMAGNPLHVQTPEEGSLEIDVEFDTVINEAPMNYNDLQGKPLINGVVLEGDKTSTELGIATKVSELDNDLNFQENVIESVSVNDTPVTVEDKNVNIEVPTVVSELENDAGYITQADVPTKVSELENDSGFITSSDIPTNVSAFNNDVGYITGIDSKDVTTALGYTPYDSANPSGYITSSDVPVKGVQKNGSDLTPDANGKVNVTVPTDTGDLTNSVGYITINNVNVKNVSENGNILQPDQDGVVDVTVPVIDDSTTGSTKLWSSDKTNTEIGNVPNTNTYNALNTTSKTIIGAINEIAYKELIGTLTAGQTTVTLSDASITTSSTIQVFTNTGINYTAISVSTGSVTITYPAQQADVNVKVRIS